MITRLDHPTGQASCPCGTIYCNGFFWTASQHGEGTIDRNQRSPLCQQNVVSCQLRLRRVASPGPTVDDRTAAQVNLLR
jgi:hypothetical protein